ncbi:hypothetical protein GT347_12045 [Xylophilus rhododendri]|uniref:Mn2+-dependent serine/threonine protein kinase n=1 Tax=Xylophilus rhododendri TaxID=2697032 RepID=A0A857JE89_9BURK|nr:hypothetical protein GT347_12045 [Xylophilus rhododendri]
MRQCLATQTEPVQRYLWRDGQVWVKRSVAARPRWHYWLLGLFASAVRLPALAPVPNPGGEQAVRTEARRLRELAARGLRVPPVLAELPQGFLMEHLGRPGQPTPSLAEEMNENTGDDPQKVLALFCQGLQATSRVHAVGTCLSQGFSRNLVRCPDGVIGYVDFEDDPQASLPLLQCQLRDVLCYVHSSAVYLLEAGQLEAAREPWRAWLSARPAALQAQVADSARRMRWLRRLPSDRRWGRDLQRARAAWALLEA